MKVNQSIEKASGSKGTMTFWLSLGIMFVIITPFITGDNGALLLFGEYNSQQIPFYQTAHNAVRTGNFLWSWHTGLGAPFAEGYGGNLLFSPFFWLTLPFPNSWVPYLMGPLIILKTALASLGAYHYVKRFVRDEFFALIGGMLYGFSGWVLAALTYNYMQDMAVFFPLLLISLEGLVTEKKRLRFAFMLALCGLINFEFFVTQLVFLVVYVVIRGGSPQWKNEDKKFGSIIAEGLMGILLCGVRLLPAVVNMIAGTGGKPVGFPSGWNFWSYGTEHPIAKAFSSLFFPPTFEHVGSGGTAWLPVVGIAVVAVFLLKGKKEHSWLKRLLVTLLVVAVIPGLNHALTLFRGEYSAFWFYIPTLFMGLATAITLDEHNPNDKSLGRGVLGTLLLATGFILALGLTPNRTETGWSFGLMETGRRFWLWGMLAVAGLLAVYILVVNYDKKWFKAGLVSSLAVVTVAVGFTFVFLGTTANPEEKRQVKSVLAVQGKIDLPTGGFARSETTEETANLLMYWGLPTTRAEGKPPLEGVTEFYDKIGTGENNKDAHVLSLLSVRWLFIKENNPEQKPLPNFVFYGNQNGYNVYENKNYIPMGFAYDHYMTEAELGKIPPENRSEALIKTTVLGYSGSEQMKEKEWSEFGEVELQRDYMTRKEEAVESFTITRAGFTAESNFETPKGVFFSVPYHQNWKAYVNGSLVEIRRANIGFMLVEVPPGAVKIEFKFVPKFMVIGGGISLVTLIGVVIYWVCATRLNKKKALQEKQEVETAKLDKVTLSWEQYLSRKSKK